MTSEPTTDDCPTCQICGGLVHSGQQLYYWDDNPLLPMHRDMQHCQGDGIAGLKFAAFLNRNAEYIFGDGPPVVPVLLEEATS